METTSCKPFSRKTHESTFKSLHKFTFSSTTVYLLRPPQHLSTNRPCILLSTSNDVVFRHPLTSKPLLTNLPPSFDIRKLNPTTLAVSNKAPSFDKLLVVPASNKSNILFALYDGGQLRVRLPYFTEWVKLSRGKTSRFDDVIFLKGNVYVLGIAGTLSVINISVKFSKISIGKSVIPGLQTLGSGRFGWRNRVVVDGHEEDVMYLVVRFKKCMLRVYKRVTREKGDCWEEVKRFDGGDKVLFITRDYYFFHRAKKFPGREYKNCIVFTEGAFPQYGNGCWEFSQFSEELGFECNDDEDVAIFRLDDECFCREGDNVAFPRIDWSPPSWIYDVLAVSGDEFQSGSSSESLDSSRRELEEDKGLDSDSKGEKNGEVQFALNDSKIKDEELERMKSDTDSQDEDGKMQCDSKSHETEDVEMHVNANTEGGASLQENVCHVSPSLFRPKSRTTDTRTPSPSASEMEITRTRLSLNRGNNATEEETSRKNITELVPKACTSSTSASHNKSDSPTAKFEGFDLRIDSVSTLEKIWRKHGNIAGSTVLRNRDIIALLLESLATLVRILDDNSPLSLSDSQADYLVSTLSDLKYNHFKVDWLSPFVEKAEMFRKRRPLVESLNNLSQLCSQVKDRRAILLGELSKLDVEEKNLKEDMAKISKMFPSCGQVKFNEPIGSGLT